MTKIWRRKDFIPTSGRMMEIRIPRIARVFKWDMNSDDVISVWYLLDNDYVESDTRKIKIHVAMMNDKIAPQVILDSYLTSNEKFIVCSCR